MTEYTIVHLLGYLTPKQWADALRGHHTDIDKERVRELIGEQEETYKFKLMVDVEAELEVYRRKESKISKSR